MNLEMLKVNDGLIVRTGMKFKNGKQAQQNK